MSTIERARLGARGTIFASRTVNGLFNELLAAGSRATFGPESDDGATMLTRVVMGEAFDKLEAAIRRELDADNVMLCGHR